MRLASNFLAMIVALVALSCERTRDYQNFTYMPDMAWGPGYKAQEPQYGTRFGAMRVPVPGTVARGAEIYPYAMDIEGAVRDLHNPLPKTREVFRQGQVIFSINCQVCHGTYGEGDGPVVPKYPVPPSLQSKKVKGWLAAGEDARIYHIITMGQGRMPRYAAQVLPEDRWAVAHYLRALIRAKNPTQADLEKLERKSE